MGKELMTPKGLNYMFKCIRENSLVGFMHIIADQII